MDLRKVAADAMRERDQLRAEVERLRHRCRTACAAAVAVVGADGPCDVDDAVLRLVARHEAAEAEVERLRHVIATLQAGARDAKNACFRMLDITDCALRETKSRTAHATPNQEESKG
jgi:hypothetical protein